jgi:hypothetical protein
VLLLMWHGRHSLTGKRPFSEWAVRLDQARHLLGFQIDGDERKLKNLSDILSRGAPAVDSDLHGPFLARSKLATVRPLTFGMRCGPSAQGTGVPRAGNWSR